jgi:hypothetical protein
MHGGNDNGSHNPFRWVGQTLFLMFKMLLLGDFDTDLFLLGEYVALRQVLFVSSMILVRILGAWEAILVVLSPLKKMAKFSLMVIDVVSDVPSSSSGQLSSQQAIMLAVR